MKKYILILATVAATIACSKDNLQTELPIKTKSSGLRIHSVSSTKAVHGTGNVEGTTFLWEAGKDRINVMLNHYDSEYGFWSLQGPSVLTNSANGEIASFDKLEKTEYEFTPMVGDTVMAFYPYDMVPSRMYSDYYRTAMGSTMQVGDNNTDHLSSLDVMLGKPVVLTEEMRDEQGDFDVPMEFAHIFSKVRFTVVNGTDAPFSINSLIYHSSNKSDVMSGVLYIDMKDHNFRYDIEEYGNCAPSNNTVLQVADVNVPAGESATLWMWVRPFDFTEGNADGRAANIYVNTSAGTFHVDNVHFDTKFEPGATYRHKLTATDAKKISEYTFIPDAEFIKMLLTFNVNGIPVTADPIKFYDFNFNEVDLSDFEPWSYSEEFDAKISSGLFVKNSEAALHQILDIYSTNAMSLEGIQAFTGLKELKVQLSLDMENVLSLRSLDLTNLTDLETLDIAGAQFTHLDLSKNTKLKSLKLEDCPALTNIPGLTGNTTIENAYLHLESYKGYETYFTTVTLDLTGCTALKSLDMKFNPEDVNISGLNLDMLSMSFNDYSNVTMINVSAKNLQLESTTAPSTIPAGVKKLVLYGNNNGDGSIGANIDKFTSIDSLKMQITGNFDFPIQFGNANSSIKTLDMYLSESTDTKGGTLAGLNYLTGIDSLGLTIHSIESVKASASFDMSNMTSCRKVELCIGEYVTASAFVLPASQKLDYVNLQFSENSQVPSSITIENLNALKHLNIAYQCGQTNTQYVNIGALPALEQLFFKAIGWNKSSNTKLVLNYNNVSSLSYPNLKKITAASISIDKFPLFGNSTINAQYANDKSSEWVNYTKAALPAVEYLYLNNSGSECESGMNIIDLRPFDNLKSMRCFWKYFDNNGTLQPRSQESIWMTKAQEDFNKTKDDYGNYRYGVYWYSGWRSWQNGTISANEPYSGTYGYGNYARVF